MHKPDNDTIDISVSTQYRFTPAFLLSRPLKVH